MGQAITPQRTPDLLGTREKSDGVRDRRAVHRRQGQGLRRGLPSGLHLRGAQPALHPPRRVHRLWGLRARLPGEGDLRRGRDPGAVETLPRGEPAVLRGQTRGPGLHHKELIPANRGWAVRAQVVAVEPNDREEARSMPKFMKVATTDELEDQQAKLVEVE